MSEKTEQPTAKKLRDARQKGQVANSKEVTSAALIISLYGLLWAIMGHLLGQAQIMISLPTQLYGVPFEHAFKNLLDGLFAAAINILMPFILLVLIVGVMANFFQVGALFVLEPLKPELKKINPAEGIKKIFSIKNLIEALKSVFKIVFLSILLYIVIKNGIPDLLKIPYCGQIYCLEIMLAELLKQVVIYSTVAFIVIAAADFFFQRFQYIKGLKMTKEEVKQEYKEMEGNPEIKGMRKQLHRQMATSDMVQKVKKSTVVVTNPTRIAIALQYQPGETPLPLIVAKGENLIAKRIIEVAREEGIPIMENVPLARALLEQGELNQYIPSDLIEAVAEVLRWVKTLQGRSHG